MGVTSGKFYRVAAPLATLLLACACLFGAKADALVVTYDLQSNQGPITLRFEADDADEDERLRFRRGEAEVTGFLDITLIFGGETYTLVGAVDPHTGLLNNRANNLSFVVSEVVRPWANTLTTVNLTFAQSMRRIRTIGDLFAYLAGAQIINGNLVIGPAAPIPVPGAAILFATAAAASGGFRFGFRGARNGSLVNPR